MGNKIVVKKKEERVRTYEFNKSDVPESFSIDEFAKNIATVNDPRFKVNETILNGETNIYEKEEDK